MSEAATHAVITPYAREPPELIARCLASVRRQSVGADHIVVSDGHPQDWIDREGVRHLRLDRAHGDCGNTARGVGALLAAAEGYRSITFLDADNWFDPDHLERCFEAARRLEPVECDYVIARRRFVRPDESVIPVPDEPIERHVDTNCLLLLRGTFHLISIWTNMPRPLAPIGDRVFYTALRSRNLVAAVVAQPTVSYHCLWEHVYRQAGEAPPAGAKPMVDSSTMLEWLRAATDRELEIASRLVGVRLVRPA